MFAEKKS